MKLSEIQAALRDRRPGIVARETGLHRNIITRVRDGRHVFEPRQSTLRKIEAYLKANK